jgi:hypothetical protein
MQVECCNDPEESDKMKVTMEVDCTPAKARLFFGLPNVEPMQDAVMAQFERRMLTEMDRFSPEGIMKSWLSLVPQNAERLQEMFGAMFMGGARQMGTSRGSR